MTARQRLAAIAASLPALLLAPTAAAQTVICIDPGHGDHDPGAVGNGLQEKDINLTTGLALRDWLLADDADGAGGGSWDVYMTRDTDVFVSLSGRASYANSLGVDYFLSLHANAGGGNGTETYAYASGTTADALAHKVQEETLTQLGTYDRGVKYASFTVLTSTAMPATLSELAFVDVWAGNAEILADDDNLDAAALGHLHAVQRQVGLSEYTPGGNNNNQGPPQGDPVGTISFTGFPGSVDEATPFQVTVEYETDLYAFNEPGEIWVEVKDAYTWAVLDQQAFNGNGAGIFGPSGSVTAELSVPPGGPDSVYFIAALLPEGGQWDDRLDADSTYAALTQVVANNGNNNQGPDDADGDGFTEAQGDCDDGDAQAHPGAPEQANHQDDDCDGLVDEGTDYYDDDGDGYTEADGDCQDDHVWCYPGAAEIGDHLDNDCDGQVDEGLDVTDDDGDGFSEAGGDCHDGDPSMFPGATETANHVDDDCDGVVDEDTPYCDDDGDGFAEVDGDCDDAHPGVYPTAPECNCDGVDNDCDGLVDEAGACGETDDEWQVPGTDDHRPAGGSRSAPACALDPRVRAAALLPVAALLAALTGVRRARRQGWS